MSESLETRLRNLPIDTPRQLSERALRRASAAPRNEPLRLRRRSFRIQAALVATFLIVAANLPAAYLFPRYATALADAPVVGGVTSPVLRAAGLTNADLSPADSTSVSNGHVLRLRAVYADAYRTVMIVEIDGQPLQSDRKPVPGTVNPPPPPKGFTIGDFGLTDQFGWSYDDQRPSPFSPVEVRPLTGLAASAGARLTLHVTALVYYDGMYSDAPTSGDWTLRATVFQGPGRNLALPAPGSIGNTHYRIDRLNVSASLLYLHVAVTGEAPQMWRALPHPGPNDDEATQRTQGEQVGKIIRTYYANRLIAPDGTEALVRSGGFGGDEIDMAFLLSGPGTYHLIIGDPATGTYEAVFTV